MQRYLLDRKNYTTVSKLYGFKHGQTVKENWVGPLGLVVLEGDLCRRDREFESHHWIIEGTFFPLVCKIVVCLKGPK